MEEENVSCNTITAGGDQDEATLPGFRFHPTEEELVGFYLKRKVEKKALKIELIKQADIYKYDPWDLPKSSNVGDKEWYFFCQRGRKYKNSIRPNRVTGSGFWKATGIDRPIYSSEGEGRDCIGLKKSLVYYRGSAGKGTKTDWMMHEFRLPAAHDRSAKHFDANTVSQEAEVWTLCRIFKRNFSYRKRIPDWKEVGSMKSTMDTNSKTCSTESSDHNRPQSGYISFNTSPLTMPQTDDRPYTGQTIPNHTQQLFPGRYFSASSSVMSDHHPSAAASFSSSGCGDVNEFLRRADWEDLRSFVDCATADANYSAFFHE